jgi:signal transduction histidine kinase/response regulator RpfG family c-di-GMP phosphodiesterase
MIAVLAAMMSGVMLSAIFSFSSMVRISRGVAIETVPQQQLFQLGSLVSEIQNAENSIRAYRLSREPNWMESFFTSSINSSASLSRLKDLAGDDQKKLNDIVLLSGLVQEKLEILESFSQLPDRFTVVSELEGVSSRLNQHEDTTGAETRTLGFIRNLFTRERQSSDRLDSLRKQVTAQIGQIQQLQAQRLRTIDATELDYLMRITSIRNEIESHIAGLRLDALRIVEEALLERERQQIASNRKIRHFSVMAGLFILLGGLAVFSYLRTRKQYEQALMQAKKSAELYASMQERFIANMSHEVRTPLHAIAGFTEQLAKPGNKDREEHLALTNSAMKHLIQVVDDILDYSKLAAGKMKLRMEPFSPIREAETVAGIFRGELEEKGLKLNLECALPEDVLLVGDALRYRQVIMNLISNAIKFSHKGSIRIKINGSQNGDTRKIFYTEISDDGSGIKKEDLEKVFMPFEQADNTTSGMNRGTGLGLAIIREIIEQQGGNIIMESRPGEGTRVVFTLPYLESGPLTDKTSKVKEADTGFLNGLRVLVSDDERWNSRLLESMLEKHGAIMTIVEDGNQAFLSLQQNPYDLVLLDLRMPGKSGLEVARLTRRQGVNRSTPIVSLTAQTIHEADKSDYAEYFDAFLTKPFTEKQLIYTLRMVLDGSERAGNRSEKDVIRNDEDAQLRKGKAENPAENLYDRDALIRLGGNDEAFAREMAEIFLRSSEKALGEIRMAMERKDHKEILWQTHKLKPAARQLAAGMLLSAITAFEQAAEEDCLSESIADLYTILEKNTVALTQRIKEDFSIETDHLKK